MSNFFKNFQKIFPLRKKISYLCFYFAASNNRKLFFEKYLGGCRSEELLRDKANICAKRGAVTLCACCTAFYNITVAVVESYFASFGFITRPIWGVLSNDAPCALIVSPRLLHRFLLTFKPLRR